MPSRDGLGGVSFPFYPPLFLDFPRRMRIVFPDRFIGGVGQLVMFFFLPWRAGAVRLSFVPLLFWDQVDGLFFFVPHALFRGRVGDSALSVVVFRSAWRLDAPLLSPPFRWGEWGVGSLFLHFLKRVEDVFLRFAPLDFRGCRGVTAGINRPEWAIPPLHTCSVAGVWKESGRVKSLPVKRLSRILWCRAWIRPPHCYIYKGSPCWGLMSAADREGAMRYTSVSCLRRLWPVRCPMSPVWGRRRCSRTDRTALADERCSGRPHAPCFHPFPWRSRAGR